MPDSNANITRTELVKRALRRIGVDNPSTDRQAQAVALLNDICKEIDAEGRWLWTIANTPTTLTLVSSQRSYAVGSTATTIASYIWNLERVEIVQGTSLIPLDIIDKTDSLTTTLREGTGQPTLVYLERFPLLTSQKMHFFPTPNAAYSVQYNYRRRLYDFDSSTDNPDFPQDWIQKLVKRLSYEIAPEYGISLNERALLKAEMDEAMAKAQTANAARPSPGPQQSVYY